MRDEQHGVREPADSSWAERVRTLRDGVPPDSLPPDSTPPDSLPPDSTPPDDSSPASEEA